MCGIVGMVSDGADVAAELLLGLRRLEYRGYDSCGMALLNGAGIVVSKDVGGPTKLSAEGFFDGLHGSTGIAHTRWATHGGVSQMNAHPHLSADGSLAIVHNGVVSNHRALRQELERGGATLASETDSEIVAHLIERERRRGRPPRDAVLEAARLLEGTFAVVILMRSEPDRLWALRRESPLVVGFSGNRVVLASDPMALRGCQEVVLVEDGELVEASARDCRIFRLEDGAPADRERRVLESIEDDPELGEYSHYMAKEMAESAAAARAALALDDERIEEAARALAAADRVFLTGMGTAYHMAYFCHYLLAHRAREFCPVVTSDELGDTVAFTPGDLVLGVSQSGETYDTLRAVRAAKSAGARTIAVCNVANSSLAREVDQVLLQCAGPEVAVLATKSALSQAVLLARIALEVARVKGNRSPSELLALERELRSVPEALEQWRDRISEEAREAAVRFLGLEKWFFLGRGLYAAVALEGALKFKEVTYRHAEGMAAGFLKHGTISLVDPEMGTAMFIPPASEPSLRSLTLTALEEVVSRGGPVLAVGHLAADERSSVDASIETPGESFLVDGLLQILAGQYLAYHTARALGRDVDRPRALAKSVTVP